MPIDEQQTGPAEFHVPSIRRHILMAIRIHSDSPAGAPFHRLAGTAPKSFQVRDTSDSALPGKAESYSCTPCPASPSRSPVWKERRSKLLSIASI